MFSSADQYYIIRPSSEWVYSKERSWLCIGGPGVDGIEFGIKMHECGVYAYYPIDNEYTLMADLAEHLYEQWISGKISV